MKNKIFLEKNEELLLFGNGNVSDVWNGSHFFQPEKRNENMLPFCPQMSYFAGLSWCLEELFQAVSKKLDENEA